MGTVINDGLSKIALRYQPINVTPPISAELAGSP